MTRNTKRSLQILITAGPTQEPIDKVRFISNHSTGRMGYEMARKALRRGHRVILISGPTNITPPPSAEFISIKTAREMRGQVRKYFKHCDCLIMTAAVSDFRPKRTRAKKIKKVNFKDHSLELVENPDILLEMGKRKDGKILIGFALETTCLIKHAQIKLKVKNLDLIVASQLRPGNYPFGDGKVQATLISRGGAVDKLKSLQKSEVADRVLERVEKISGAMAE